MYQSEISKKHDEAYQANQDLIESKKEAERKAAIQKWLDENPEVGVLSSACYYIIVDGVCKQVEPLSDIKLSLKGMA